MLGVAIGIVQPAGQVVIDGPLGDREDADEARDRHGAEKVEDDARSEPIGGKPGKHRRDRVAGVIERLVAANPAGEGGVAEDAERNGCNRRRKDRGGGLRYSLRDHDWQECRKQGKRQRGRCHHDGGDNHHQPFRPRRIDQGPGRCLCHDAGDRRDRHHQANACLVPMLLGKEIDGEIGPEPVADVGEEEIGRIQRAAGSPRLIGVSARHQCFGRGARSHRRQPSRPSPGSARQRRAPQNLIAKSTAPAPIMAMPSQPCAVGRSPRKANANRATSTTLSLSIGATSVAGPSLSARK
ncbi:hypothetical protein ACVJ19_006844 [Bradyrhizobium sp. USDA 376]